MREFTHQGKPLGSLPAPGVYARHNAVDTPALLPDGSPAAASVSRVLAARGTMRRATGSAAEVDATIGRLGGDPTTMPETAGRHAAVGSSEEDVVTEGDQS